MEEKTITDVRSDAWQTLVAHGREKKLILITAVVLACVIFRSVIPLFIALPGILLFYIYFYHQAHKRFMRQFATRNNLTYVEKGIVTEDMKAGLFNIGHSRNLSNIVTGEYESFPMRIFNYVYVTGGGKSRRTHYFTVCEMTFPADLPPIKLVAKSYDPTVIFGFLSPGFQRLTLEENFEKVFTLLASAGYETEALQIFTREFLAFMVAQAPHFSIELVKDKLYIYDDAFVLNKEDLDKLYGVLKQIMSLLGPLLARMKDDFDALRPYYGK